MILFLGQTAFTQKFMSRNVQVKFLSETPIEDIDATNDQVSSLFDTSTGQIVFQVPIRGFHFEIALMEEHFNENYMESEEFPNSTLQGKIENWEEVNSEGGDVVVVGELTIHGITVNRSFDGNIKFEDGNWIVQSEFAVNAEDFGIKIPKIVRGQIAETIVVMVEGILTPRK